MDTRSFLYALWSLAITGLFLIATAYGWSPFAEGGRASGYGYSGGGSHGGHGGYYGPNHK